MVAASSPLIGALLSQDKYYKANNSIFLCFFFKYDRYFKRVPKSVMLIQLIEGLRWSSMSVKNLLHVADLLELSIFIYFADSRILCFLP